jgi:hypothetical protein
VTIITAAPRGQVTMRQVRVRGRIRAAAGRGVHRLCDALVELGLVEPAFAEVGGQAIGYLGAFGV